MIVQLSFAQPTTRPNNGQGNPCANPNNPNCNNVPISGLWILLLGGGIVGTYYIRKEIKSKRRERRGTK